MNKNKKSQSVNFSNIANIAGKTFVVVASAVVAVLAVILAIKVIGFVALNVLWPLAKAAFGLTFSGLFGIFLPYQLVKRSKHFKAGYEKATKKLEKKEEKQ